MSTEEHALEHTVMISITMAVIGAMLALLMGGCTVQAQYPGQQMTAAKAVAAGERPSSQRLAKALEVAAPTPVQAPVVQAPPLPAPEPVAWQPVYQPSPPRPERVYPVVEPMAAGGKTITFRPGEKPVLSCAETATLTIKFPAGERIINYGVGASGEWILGKETMGIDLPIDAITVGRVPSARTAEMHVLTDAEVYQFILSPSAGGVSQKQATLIQIVNVETDARRAERQKRRMEVAEAERREREPQVPPLDPMHLRTYRVGGDNVPWKPVSVVGDNQRTIIQLPAGGVTQPTLTAIEDGKEVRVNTRTVLKADGKGPRIVVDQPFTEARLIGEGGSVSILGGN